MMSSGQRLFEELMRFKPDGLTANGWAVSAGVSRTIWADLRRHGNPSRRTLEKLLCAAGMTLAEFEALRIEQAASNETAHGALADPGRGWPGAALPAIPVFAAAPAAEWGEQGSGIEACSVDRTKVAGKVDRPRAIASDTGAYAVMVAGNSMWPRYRAGRRLIVSPAAGIAIGDDVLVELGDGRFLLKELAGRTPGRLKLRQFNPDVTFVVGTGTVNFIHRVVGQELSL